MTDIVETRGKKLVEVQHAKGLFQVYEVQGSTGPAYHGYFNDKLSVTGTGQEFVLLGLQRKHLAALPAGELISFAEAAAKLRKES